MSDDKEDEKNVPRSIFFTKYFSGKPGLTHLHWKKNISGMSRNNPMSQAYGSCGSSILDDDSDQNTLDPSPGSSEGTNVAELLLLQNDDDQDACRSVGDPVTREENISSSEATSSFRGVGSHEASFSRRVSSSGEAPFNRQISSSGEATFHRQVSSSGEATFHRQVSSSGEATYSCRAGSSGEATYSCRAGSSGEATFSCRTSSSGEETFSCRASSSGEAPFNRQVSSSGEASYSYRAGRSGEATSACRASSSSEASPSCRTGKKRAFPRDELPANGAAYGSRYSSFATGIFHPWESDTKSFSSSHRRTEAEAAPMAASALDLCHPQRHGLSRQPPPPPCPDIVSRPSSTCSSWHTSSSGGQRHRTRVPSVSGDSVTHVPDSQTPPCATKVEDKTALPDTTLCQVCEDIAAGFYCGAFVCEACKKFFIRASKQEKQKFVCLRESMCKITKESRVQCQFCRFQKCLQLSMYYPGEGKRSVKSIHVSGIPCRVCGSPSSGFHFGALTCEGCKGFFRRMVKEREPGMYKCSSGGNCEISMHTRNMCKACRYQKCVKNGMSVEGSRIGRQPNAVKHAISLEVKKQHLEQAAEQASHMCAVAAEEKKLARKKEEAAEAPGRKSVECSRTADSSSAGSFHGPVTPVSFARLPSGPLEVKDDPDDALNLSQVVLTEVSPSTIVKQEPNTGDEGDEEEALASSFETAGKELSYMCALSRAKTDTINRAEFGSYPTMWKKQMKHFDFHAQCCIRFSKKVPGFRQLPLDDKVALVQNAIYPIVVLNHARHYELHTGFYNFFNFTKPEEAAIVRMCPGYTTLQDHFRHMGVMAQTMEMNDVEFTLLSCLLLCDPECPGLQSPALVGQLQTHIISYFQSYELKSSATGLVRFGELLLRISELKLASLHHIQTISGMLAEHPDLEVPQLFREMFF